MNADSRENFLSFLFTSSCLSGSPTSNFFSFFSADVDFVLSSFFIRSAVSFCVGRMTGRSHRRTETVALSFLLFRSLLSFLLTSDDSSRRREVISLTLLTSPLPQSSFPDLPFLL